MMILIFIAYHDVKDYMDLKNFNVNYIYRNYDKNKPINIDNTNIMFSFKFENSLL